MKRIRILSRNFEMIMGIIGSVIGIFSGSFLIFLKSVGPAKPDIAGIGFVIATMFVIVGSDYINVISAIFLLVAGVSALFRK